MMVTKDGSATVSVSPDKTGRVQMETLKQFAIVGIFQDGDAKSE